VKPWRGNKAVGGGIPLNLQAYQLGTLLKGALGAVTTTGTGPYTHVIKVGQSLPSFVVEKGFTDIGKYFKYNGVKVGGFTIEVAAEGRQRVTLRLAGAKETGGTSSFDSTPTDAGYKPWDGFQVASIMEGGAAIATVTRARIELDNDLDTGADNYPIGAAGEAADIPEGVVRVSGSLTALFTDTTLYDKAVNATESSLKVAWQFGSGDGSAGNEYLEILVPELVFAPKTPTIRGPKGLLVELDFEGYYDDGSEGTSLQITLKNTEDSL